jgi:hypothetical protein
MKKQIVLCGVFFSSFVFGMEQYYDSLELECRLEGLGTRKAFLPITFKEAFAGACHPCATIVENTNMPAHFNVQLPKDAYTYLSGGQKTYVNSILSKERSTEALQKLLSKNDNARHIIMTVHSSHVPPNIALLGQYSFLLEIAELPRSIKKGCNITSLSKTEMQQYILIPALCFFALLAYCGR